ncbi:MAG: response regulator transcription factor [Deltaproteobacteria bacterium]|nr:response regulator transcription factor [Deltaproteobacteria bacterium]
MENSVGTILLVDDEELLLEIGQDMLDSCGYKVIVAASGEEAVDIYRSEKDDIRVVILDLNMPGMGGIACLQRLISLRPDVKVIISSGYTTPDILEEVKNAGAAGFVGKPYQLDEMIAKICDILDKQGPLPV